MGELTFLDGPMGTELERRGLALPAPAWSAVAVAMAPDLVAAIHADYAAAGADVHTAATFRTTRRALAGTPWEGRAAELLRTAVDLARAAAAAAPHHPTGRPAMVAGSLAPLEDCFTPAATPDDDALAAEHGELAGQLAEAGCDLLLVETMPTLRELTAATRAAVATGLPVWASVTLGPRGDFFDAAGLAAAAGSARDAGAEAFAVNCSPADRIARALAGLGAAPRPPRLGAYGNAIFAGHLDWPPAPYAEAAADWVAAGADIVGGCCGTGPAHLAALRARLASPPTDGA